jgi:predicted Ser/Thr protein kinase
MEKTYLAKGKRGIVYTAIYRGKTVLLKEKNPASAVDTIEHEAQMLQIANTKGIGPTFISYNGTLMREFVDGPEIMDWMENATRKQILAALCKVLVQCRALDELGINKLEMTHPQKHILMHENMPVMIDFDRSRKTLTPKNVTQVCQWITGTRMQEALGKKKIHLDKALIIESAREYKKEYNKSSFEKILRAVRSG